MADAGVHPTVSSFIVPFPAELNQKASKELQEKIEWRKRDADALREMIRAEATLSSCLDDFFILRFLRVKKFDYDNALKLFLNYYRVKCAYPEIFADFTPKAVKNVFDDNVLAFLDGVDYYGRKILVFKPHNWKSECGFDEIIKALLLSLELILCNEVVQLHGVIVIVDANNLSLSQIMQRFKPALIKKALHCLQGAFPCRLKAIHFINDSHITDAVLLMLKPFLTQKIRDRMFFHGSDFASLHLHVDQQALPVDIGGEADKFSASNWFKLLVGAEPYFQYLSAFGYREHPSLSQLDADQSLHEDGSSFKTAFHAYKRFCIDGLN